MWRNDAGITVGILHTCIVMSPLNMTLQMALNPILQIKIYVMLPWSVVSTLSTASPLADLLTSRIQHFHVKILFFPCTVVHGYQGALLGCAEGFVRTSGIDIYSIPFSLTLRHWETISPS